MNINGTTASLNGLSIRLDQSMLSTAKVIGIEVGQNNHFEIHESTDLGKVRWLFYDNGTGDGLFILGSADLQDECVSWSDWSEESELKRKGIQDKLLKQWGLKRGKCGPIEIDNQFDRKGGFSAISIRCCRTRRSTGRLRRRLA